MPSLLIVMLAVELIAQLVNTVGATTINGLLWNLVVSLPVPISKQFSEQRTKQKEYLVVRRELTATSSQDEFAKWAKLRRQHDKLLEDLEKKKTALEASRTNFDRYLTAARLISTRGVQWFLPFWYSAEPMFWLPYGWFPYYVEWFASFPRAPIGSVSIVVWQWACTAVLKLVFETAMAAYGLAIASKQKAAPVAAEKTKVEGSNKDL